MKAQRSRGGHEVPPRRLAEAEPPSLRLVALDKMRGFIVGLVVLHHAVLAYCTFGHVNTLHYALSTAPIVDPNRWRVFDAVVLVNDAFFMPMLFLLSGLFVIDGLRRRGPGGYLRTRLLRLGVPFVVAELTVVPLAYYPSFLQAGGAPGFLRFWATTLTTGPQPSGPPWFIGVLLLFDAAAALAWLVTRHARGVAATRAKRPDAARCFLLLLAGSCLLYLPLLLTLGSARWFSLGPLAIQGSRIGLYAGYFAAGVALGRTGKPEVVRFGESLGQQWRVWACLAVPMAVAMMAGGAAGQRRTFQDLPAWTVHGIAGVTQAGFCAAACFAVPAVFFRFAGRSDPIWNSLPACSYGIYLLHYPLVTWIQYALLSVPAAAALKGTLVFATAFTASWAGTALLRQLSFARRVL